MPAIHIRLLFLGVILSLVSIGTVSIYIFLLQSFAIESSRDIILLGISLSIGTAVFIGITIVGQYFDNRSIRIMYRFSAVWMAVFCYLLLGSAIASCIELLLGVSQPSTLFWIGTLISACAIILTVFGYIHAQQIHVHTATISLPNMPESWRGKSAVWVSDIHLGHIYGIRRSQQIVDIIQKIKPDIVFVGGDVFDGTKAPNLRALVEPFTHVRAPHGMYYITGNHEEFGATNVPFLDAVRGVGMQVLTDEYVDIEGLQIIGVDYANAAEESRFKAILDTIAFDTSKPSILLKHEPKHLHIAEAAKISLQLSGHTHRAQLWPLEYIARLAYGGYAYGLKKLGAMQVLVSSGAGTWGPPVRVGTQSEIVHITFS